MFCNIKKFLVKERNFLSQEEEIYFTVKKYLGKASKIKNVKLGLLAEVRGGRGPSGF